jgi:hypothetical protein
LIPLVEFILTLITLFIESKIEHAAWTPVASGDENKQAELLLN